MLNTREDVLKPSFPPIKMLLSFLYSFPNAAIIIAMNSNTTEHRRNSFESDLHTSIVSLPWMCHLVSE